MKTDKKTPGKEKSIAKSFLREPKPEQKVGPEEFEEDRDMNLRMKPQPLDENEKNKKTKNES